jgi:hypothetical protein
MSELSPEQIELAPLEIDSRPCEECGLTLDRHRRVDTPEGPEFFCIPPDEMDIDELERRAELIRQIEIAAILARMEAMDLDEAPEPVKPVAKQSYRVPQSTIDAFFYVASLNDAEYLKRWLEQHPRDAETLCKLWEGKNALKA